MKRSHSIGLRATLAFGSALGTQSELANAAPPPTTTQPHETDIAPRQTADQLLQALRRSKPLRDLVTPASGMYGVPSATPLALLPEGTTIVDWEGYLTRKGSWWTFIVESPEGEPPTKLLPNINVEIMTRTMVGKPSPMRFSVSGELTVFQNENYLLARFIRRITTTQPSPPPAPTKEDRNAEGSGAESNADATPRAEDVIADLQGRKPRTTVPSGKRAVRRRSIGVLPPRSVKPDGSVFDQRPGRITRDGLWWNFAFETDHPDSDQPMIKLLPSRGLELMIRMAGDTPDGLVMLVSGELTLFDRENYLLPQGVLRRSGTDNLRR